MASEVVKFNPISVRSEVVLQLEQMQVSRFVKLPDDYKESAFFAIEKLTTLDDIEKVPAIEITKTLIKVFKNKLDFQKNHCYFFVQNDKHSPTGKSLRFGWQYQGLVSVVKRECDVLDVFPVLVYNDDHFESHYEYGALIIDKHTPTFKGDIIGGYCVIELSDHRYIVKYYTKPELDMRREKSMAKQGKFWAWEREMYEKTLINATLKRIIETNPEIGASDLYSEPETSDRKAIDAEIIPQKDIIAIQQPEVLSDKKFKL